MRNVFNSNGIKIDNNRIGSFIGTLTSAFPGNKFSPLYYKAISKFNKNTLKY